MLIFDKVTLFLYRLTEQLFDLWLLNGNLDSTCAVPAAECVDNDLPSARGIRAETHQLPRGMVLQALKTAHTIDGQF